MHGVTHTIERIRELGVPGYEVEVIGTDRNVDRRLPAVAEVEMPFYAGLEVGVPSLPAMVEALAEGRFDLVHLTAPGPAGDPRGADRADHGLPALGSYHTELGAYAGLRTGDPSAGQADAKSALALFYRQCERRPLAEPGRPTHRCAASASRPSGSGAGGGAWTPRASTPRGATPEPTRARSRSSTPAG